MSNGKAKKYDWYPYHFILHRGSWAVYRWTSEKRTSAEKVNSFMNWEDARNEAYTLNKAVKS